MSNDTADVIGNRPSSIKSLGQDIDSSHHSLGSGTSHSGFSNGSKGAKVAPSSSMRGSLAANQEIAQRETKYVYWLRFLVIFVLTTSTLVVSLLVHKYVVMTEHEDFTTRFESDATKILDSIGTTLDQTLGATDSFVVQMVSYARASNSSWPFVTVPNFAVKASKLLKLSKAFTMLISLKVTPDEATQWEEYASVTGPEWLDDALHVQRENPEYEFVVPEGPINTTYEIFRISQGDVVPVNKTEGPSHLPFYLPIWQQAPVNDYLVPYNLDEWRIPFVIGDLYEMFGTGQVIVGTYQNIIKNATNEREVEQVSRHRAWLSNYVANDQYKEEPQSEISYPILTTADQAVYVGTIDDSVASSGSPATTASHVEEVISENIVGRLRINIQWRNLITNILPNNENSNGIMAVFSEACGEDTDEITTSFTYRIDGGEVTFVGVGDQHDTAYNNLVIQSTLSDLMVDTTTLSTSSSSYTGISINTNYCPKTISIYPSYEMEQSFISGDSTLFTIAAATIFIFTSLIFVSYDYLVARRQRIVMNRAVKAGAIVSSLFPDKFRDQLYESQAEPNIESTGVGKRLVKKLNTRSSVGSRDTSFDDKDTFNHSRDETSGEVTTTEGGSTMFLEQHPSHKVAAPGKQIADLFEETTVML